MCVDIDTKIQQNKVQYNEGDLSLDRYNKNDREFMQQKESAEATIEGILLKMRG